MISSWLEYGQDYEQFWRLTPREIHAILGGVNARLIREHHLRQQNNFELASSIAYAFHDPKNIPQPDQHEKSNVNANISDEVAQAQVRGFFMAMASRSN